MDNQPINFLERQIEKYVQEMRPPEEIREKLDIGYSFENQSLEIFEIRPRWDNKDIIFHSPFAKAKYIKSRNIWKIYWMRANGNWDSYSPQPEVNSISTFFKIVEEDKHYCFKG